MKKKIITILFALILVSALCLVVGAEEYAEWTISNDEKTLILNDTVYELYEGYLYPSDSFRPEVSFLYENEYYYSELKRNNENLDILYVNGSYYVSKDGKNALDDFVDGKFHEYKIVDRFKDSYSDTSLGWLNSLDGGKTQVFDVRDLKNSISFYLLGYDKTGTVAHKIGAIHSINDELYFINYDKLPNNYFDSTGNFSFLRGEVTAYKLNDLQKNEVSLYLENMARFKTETEDNGQFTGLPKGFYITVFVIITALVGYVAPLIPTVIGTIRIVRGKTQNPKRWYLMIILCSLWIILATCVLLAMIL